MRYNFCNLTSVDRLRRAGGKQIRGGTIILLIKESTPLMQDSSNHGYTLRIPRLYFF